MSVYAVISEFNPFHNGHKHLIDTLKRDEDSSVISIMSGSFVERGDVAIIDKYARAEAALMCGADLVLELPAPWCFAGAEFFALGGVSVADSLGVVNHLAFGSESGSIDLLTKCADNLSSAEFSAVLSTERKKRPDINAAVLRAEVYERLFGQSPLFGGSNDLLALEYIKALKRLGSKISPCTIKREGGEYNSGNLEGICSATAIRRAVFDGNTNISEFMPPAAAQIFHRELEAGRIYKLSRLDAAVIAKLRTCAPSELAFVMEAAGGIENRLCDLADFCRSIEELVCAVRDRHYSASRIRRMLISSMLGVTMKDVESAPMFTNVLAANAKGRQVLALARKQASISILSKPSASGELSENAKNQYDIHIRAERLAELCCEGIPRRIAPIML